MKKNSIPEVYHFILDHRVGGPHVYVDTIREVLTGKFKTTIVTTGRGGKTDIALLNLRHLWIPLYVLEVMANSFYLVVMMLNRRLTRNKVIFNVHGSANIAPILAARVLGIPVVWHFHESMPRFIGLVKLGKFLLKGSPHKLIAVAKKAAAVYDLHDVIIMPGVVDTKFWSRELVPKDDVAACNWPKFGATNEKPFSIVVVSNLSVIKGIDILLDAISEVDGPWNLKIIGAELDSYQEYIQGLKTLAAKISNKNRRCNIEFIGRQDREQIRAFLASCDLFVLPSRSEACPIALLEAMAMGCRCIASDVGDIPSMLKDYERGYIFCNESVTGLELALREVMKIWKKNPTQVYIDGNHSELSDFAVSLSDLYCEVLSQTQGSR